MRDLGLGDYSSIDKFVKAKLTFLDGKEISFLSLFELMFREKENIMYEQSAGYRILRTTYGEAKEAVLRRTAVFKERFKDLQKNSVIGLYMDNGLDWIVTFWAIILSGFCPLLMNLRLPDGVLETALSDAGAKAVISDSKAFKTLTVLLNETGKTEDAAAPDICGSEVFVMSSGTSGNLKICGYTANEFYHQVLGSYDIIKKCKMVKRHYNGYLKLLTFLPFYHIFGLVAVYIWFAFFSRTFVHLSDMNPSTIVNTVKRHNVTHIFAVPLFWEKVYERALKTIKSQGVETWQKFSRGLKIALKIGDLPIIGRCFTKFAFAPVREKMFGDSIRFMITGGSSVPGYVLEFFNAIGYPLANGYGMTEIGITSVELSKKAGIRNSGSVGTPLKGIEYKTENGRLFVRGKSCAHSIREGKEVRLLDGWYDTGDLAECIGGRYMIKGRADDVVIAPNGENVNPELIEPYFCLENVKGAVIIAEKKEEGDLPLLLVSVKRTLSEKKFSKLQSDIKNAAQSAEISPLIGKTVYTDDPLIGENEFKINRSRLTALYNSGKINLLPAEHFKSETAKEEDSVTITVRDMFASVLGEEPEDIRSDADFFLDEGGTSLDYFALVSELKEKFDVPFPNELGGGLNTVSSISDFIKAGSKNDD